MKSWLKGGLIAISIVVVYYLGNLVYTLIKNPTFPKNIEILSFLIILFFTFIIGASLGLSVGLVVDLIKGSWKKSTNFKRAATIASIPYLLIILYYTIKYTIYSLMNAYECPALVDTVRCKIVEVPFYVSQVMIIIGIPTFLVILVLGALIGWIIQKARPRR